MLLLSFMYLDGEGVKKDRDKSFEYGLKAAEAGDDDAQFMIGKLYLEGGYFERSLEKAKE